MDPPDQYPIGRPHSGRDRGGTDSRGGYYSREDDGGGQQGSRRNDYRRDTEYSTRETYHNHGDGGLAGGGNGGKDGSSGHRDSYEYGRRSHDHRGGGSHSHHRVSPYGSGNGSAQHDSRRVTFRSSDSFDSYVRFPTRSGRQTGNEGTTAGMALGATDNTVRWDSRRHCYVPSAGAAATGHNQSRHFSTRRGAARGIPPIKAGRDTPFLPLTRSWIPDEPESNMDEENVHTFRMMTYNCLAPSLCDANMYLYKSQQRAHGREVIDFYTRGPRLIKEIAAQDCDIICLQEVDERHFTSFYEPQLKTYGYEGTFVPCTGTKTDGSAILVKTSQFTMVEFRHVQYHPHKHNVGIVCILQSVKTGRPICITTTHILWSPKGGETKLAQLMLLMQNMKHLIEQHEVVYGMNLPVLLCGDFNINPGSFIYNFLRAGRADMKSAIPKTMSGQLADKRRGTGLAKATWSVIKGMFPLSVFAAFPQIGGDTTVQADGWLDWCSIPTYSGTAANGAWIHQPSDSGYPPDTSDAPLIARHPFHFLSVYAPYNDPTTGEPYFTTWHEADQEVVDFIFMGELRNEARSRATTTTRFVPGESTLSADGLNPSLSVTQADAAPQQMTLLECLRYLKPPRASETEKMPNANVPSDHVMLVAEFRLSGAKGFCEEFGDLGF